MKKLAKYLRLAMLVITCAALGFGFGWQLAPRENIVETMSPAEGDPLEEFRREREQLRAMQKSQLNDIIHGVGVEPEIAGMAQRQLIEICESEEAELTLEGVLRMRGYEDCVVTVHNASVNVLLHAGIITQQDSSLILELVCRETGVQSGNVKIIPINSAK
ncbi:MAG: SpoIIIAH-like family protein [Clostridia bacterium]|nr:SpoIIIAH-like family protein [Clostridia bacterium]